MKICSVCVLTCFSVLFGVAVAAPENVFCYFQSWAVYRPSYGQFDVENIPADLCTHILYGFVGIGTDGGVTILDSWNEIDLGALQRFTSLKSQNPSLKTLISIGGWNQGSEGFSTVAGSATLRDNFVSNVVGFLETYGFDGLDIVWEYPNQRGGVAADVQNFVTLLSQLRTAFSSRGYLLTAGVAANLVIIDAAYDVYGITQYLDYILLMTYDYHGTWDLVTGQNAPLYARAAETDKTLNVNATVQYYISLGAPREKILLGIATYGRSYTLSDPADHNVGSPILYEGNSGPYTGAAGTLSYPEICIQSGLTTVFDTEQRVPYSYADTQWFGYDNELSVGYKAIYAIQEGLGGVAVWSIDEDDSYGLCGTTFPLIKSLKTTLGLN